MALVMFKCFDCEFISSSMQDVKIHIQLEHEAEVNHSETNNSLPLLEITDGRSSDQESTNVVSARVVQTSMKWGHQMVLYLIECYKKHQDKFHKAGYFSKQVWNLISKDFSQKYEGMSGEACYDKWRNLKRTYRNIKRNLETYGTSRMKFLYFDEMDSIYSKHPELLRPAVLTKGLSNETTFKVAPEIEVIPCATTVTVKPSNSSNSIFTNSNTIFEIPSVSQKEQEKNPKQTLPHCCSHLLSEIKKIEEVREVSAQRRHQEKMALMRELINIKKQKLLMLQKLE